MPLADPNRRSLLRAGGLLLLGGATSACSGLLPGQGPPPALYRLTPKSTFRPDLPKVEWQLVVEAPVTNASLNTTRIALQRSPMEIEYYANAGWVGPSAGDDPKPSWWSLSRTRVVSSRWVGKTSACGRISS